MITASDTLQDVQALVWIHDGAHVHAHAHAQTRKQANHTSIRHRARMRVCSLRRQGSRLLEDKSLRDMMLMHTSTHMAGGKRRQSLT